MDITTQEKENYVLVSLTGRLDTSNYEDFSKQLNTLIESGTKFLVINLNELKYISSSGLRVFLSTLKTLRAIEGDVVLCCMNQNIKSVFEVSGFISLFRVEDSIDNIN